MSTSTRRRWSCGRTAGSSSPTPPGGCRGCGGSRTSRQALAPCSRRASPTAYCSQAAAPLYAALGAHVVGVARTPRTDGPFPVVDDVDAVLPTADVLVMILPTAPSTDRALDAGRLALLPRAAWLVNVGRGSTVDEDALADALRAGALAGAALDVTQTEPLPVDSPLWDLPNVLLTPHAAGGRPRGAAALIAANARARLAGEPLTNLVDR